MSDLVGNPNCWFSHAKADILFQSSGHLAGVHYVGVSHSGIYLIQRVKNMVEDYLDVIEHIR